MIDLRLPIGIFFILVGVILMIFGLVSPTNIPNIDVHINIDLYWGIVLLLFGIPMTFFGLRAERKIKKKAST